LNEEKNHLISIVAHDLRNPLTSALSMAQLISSDEEKDEKSEIGNVLAGSLKRMNEMVEKILDIRAIESREINIEKELFDMGEETGMIIDEFTAHAAKKSLTIHRNLNQAEVSLDRYYFKQIVENLFSNAIKFSPEGRSIYVSTEQLNGKAMLNIRDEGPGFTEEDKNRMFGKYQKLSAKPTGGESSTGIGLSIVKKYVDAMGGTLSCQSYSGEGATFKVEFNNK
jgi:signal transduction histidine kinase